MAELHLLGARLLTGLLGGLYLGFAVAVLPGLARLDDETYVKAFNHINAVIVNPLFMVVFLGSPALAATLPLWDRSPSVIAAAGLSLAALISTLVRNVPLNNELAAGCPRESFESRWTRWHHLRTCAMVASAAMLAW
ncbi:DUF1772 domain-containing protein [Ruania suaedae]|uniref:anthrone oxygenase family protein n=1 Tax=Ruania suaedae TaxID=2897774 RepID=UPI001E5EE7B9|nr:anthrone oxygenase family protein [Ruania suaedae]UFU02491.1 DUF1772 domain-containing protein [Ruania suaedae]